MDAESARAYLLSLPHVSETRQWGDNLVFWVGTRGVGGRMFCLLDLDAGTHGVASFAAEPERYAELVEREGLRPAPYLARAFWVSAGRWSALRPTEWRDALAEAHTRVWGRLPRRVRDGLAAQPAQSGGQARKAR